MSDASFDAADLLVVPGLDLDAIAVHDLDNCILEWKITLNLLQIRSWYECLAWQPGVLVGSTRGSRLLCRGGCTR